MSICGAFITPHPPLIVPEIGRGQERSIQKTQNSFMEISRRVAALKPETIVVLSPHSVMYSDYFHISPGSGAKGGFERFGAAEHVESEKELDPARYGVIVSSGFRRGLLLPNLEGVDTADEQVSIAKRKAGIGPSEKYSLERFEVVRHK